MINKLKYLLKKVSFLFLIYLHIIFISLFIFTNNVFSQTCDTLTNNSTNLGIYGGLAVDLTYFDTGRLFASALMPASLFISDDTGKTFYHAFPNDSMIYECGQRGWGGGAMYTRTNSNSWVATYTKENAGSLSSIVVSFQNGDTNTWSTAIDSYLLEQMGYGNARITGMNLSDYYLYGLLHNYIVKINTGGFDSSDIINIYDKILGLDSSDYVRSIASANTSSGFPFYAVIDSFGSIVNAPKGKLYKYDGLSFSQLSIPTALSGISKVYTHPNQISGDTMFIVGRSSNKQAIYRSYDGGVNWTNISTSPGLDLIEVNYSKYWKSVFPNSDGLILNYDGGIISTDLGNTIQISGSLPSTSIFVANSYTLCISPTDSSHVIGSNATGIYSSINGVGGPFFKTDAIGLEAVFINNITKNKNGSIFYLATEAGIAYTTKYKNDTITPENKWKSPYGMFPIDSTDVIGGISGIAIDQGDSLHVIAGYDDGVFFTKTGPYGFKLNSIPYYKIGGSTTMDIEFINSNVIISVTGALISSTVGNGDIWRTADGGETWQNVSPSGFGTGTTVAVQYLDSDTIVYVGSGSNDVEDGYIWKSTDLGLTWAIVNNGPHSYTDTVITNLPIQDIAIFSDTIYISASSVFTSNQGSALVMSTDQGLTYHYLNIDSISDGLDCIEIDQNNPDSVVYISAGNQLYRYNPALDTTALIYTGLPGDIIYDLSIGSILVGTTTGFYGIFYDDVEDIVVKVPNASSLENKLDIYPNPANDVITISWDLKKTTNLVIEIHDIFGKLIKSQTITNVEPISQTSIHINDIANGSYIVRTTCGSERINSRLIIISTPK